MAMLNNKRVFQWKNHDSPFAWDRRQSLGHQFSQKIPNPSPIFFWPGVVETLIFLREAWKGTTKSGESWGIYRFSIQFSDTSDFSMTALQQRLPLVFRHQHLGRWGEFVDERRCAIQRAVVGLAGAVSLGEILGTSPSRNGSNGGYPAWYFHGPAEIVSLPSYKIWWIFPVRYVTVY